MIEAEGENRLGLKIDRPAKSFRDLIVWQKAHGWVLKIYLVTKKFPKEELFGLTSQLRRAAVSLLLILQKDLNAELLLKKQGFTMWLNHLWKNVDTI